MIFKSLSLVFTLLFTISSAAYAKTGAGVCPVFDDGSVLLGKEMRRHGPVWSEFGGKQDPNETLAQTGHREFKEETAHYTFPNITLADIQNAPYADHIHPATGQSYRTYFLWIHGPKPAVQTIHKNAALAKKNLGHKAHVEKSDWNYFDAQVIMNAHNQNGNLPGANAPLYEPLKAIIRTSEAQTFFTNFMNTVKNSPTPPPPQKKSRKLKQKQAPKLKPPRHASRKSTGRVRHARKVTRRSAPKFKQTRQIKHRNPIKRTRTPQQRRKR